MRATLVVAWTLVVILAAALAGGWYQYASRDREVSDLQSGLNTLEQQLRTRTATQQKLGQQLEGAQEEIDRVQKELKRTSASLKDHQAELEEEGQNAAVARREASRLKAKLDEMTSSVAGLETEKANLAATRNEISVLKTKLEEVSARLKSRESELEQVQNRAKTEKTDLQESVRQLQASVQDLERDLAGLRDKLASARTGNEELKARNVSATQALEDLRGELTSTRKGNEELKVRNVSATKAVAALRDENNKLRNELKRFSKQMQDLETASFKEKETRLSLGVKITALRKRFEEAVRDKEREIRELKASQRLLLEKLQPEIKSARVTVKREKEHISIRLLNRVLFDAGQAQLTAGSKKALDEIYAGLGPIKDGLIVIEGHADARKIRGLLLGRFPSNWELSLARASAVVRYLQEKGMDPKRMSVAGYSYYRPADTNLSAIGRSRNRRVEIKLIPPISSSGNGTPALTKQ
jgi:chemotaxis protein MotB